MKLDALQEDVNESNHMLKRLLSKDASVNEVVDDILEDWLAETNAAFDGNE